MDKYKLNEYISANPDAKLRDLVMNLLYDEIVSLRIAPGTKLNVNQIAASLGISRTPVAEAVGSLADIGFVVSHPGQAGNFVLEAVFCSYPNAFFTAGEDYLVFRLTRK